MSSYFDAINQTTSSSTGTTTAQTSNEAVMGKEDFLKLLVAQMQNQDPLSPDDPTEFTAQLAQFSSLEQLFTLNESVNNMVASSTSSDQLATLNTIGKDVSYFSSSFEYNGESIEIGYELDGSASEVSLSLISDGQTVAILEGEELTEGRHFISWEGLSTTNEAAPHGKYQIVMQAKSVGEDSVAAAPLVKSEVTGVDLDGTNGGILITQAGQVAFNSILGVFEPVTK